MIVLGMAGPLRPELLAAMVQDAADRARLSPRGKRLRHQAEMRRWDAVFASIQRGNHYANRRRAADPLARLRNQLEVDAALTQLRDDPLLARLRSAR